MWRFTAKSVIGSYHVSSGLPCQDSSYACADDELFIAAIADGAGSGKLTHISSQWLTRYSVDSILAMDAIPDSFDAWMKYIWRLLGELNRNIVAMADKYQCSGSDLATTFILTVAGDSFILGVQIGDGATAVGSNGDGKFQLLTQPSHGEYYNETSFITSPDYVNNCQIKYVPEKIDNIILFSDGLQMLALDMKSKPPRSFAPFLTPFVEFVRNNDDRKDRDIRLEGFLRSPRLLERTNDDKSINVAVRMND